MIQRDAYLNKLIQFRDTDLIKVITGVRRSGKSVLLRLYRDYLKSQDIADEQIIYLNFEELELLSVRTAEALIAVLTPKLDKTLHQYLMFDEI
ncbi:ATPase component BioM of energizing module ofbiotin ECF transporter [Lactiplantibacillus plantarum]|nr:ATPase component BioM of energizing module ofbiotin ECF transporter [Lactiplantibacillus plantarum]